MQDPTKQPANAVSFIRFHGLTLLVVEHQGVEYVPLKPLSDLAGIDWRTTKNAISEGDSAHLYDAKWLIPPVFAGSGGAIPPTNTALHIRLDRARLYLARINTARMKAAGNVEAAEMLLALQIEWAEALHAYETHGVAIKAGRTNALREIHQLARTRALMTDPGERKALTALLHEELRALGLPADSLDDRQGQLPLPN